MLAWVDWIGTTVDGPKDTFGTRHLATNQGQRHPTLADAEGRAKVANVRNIKDDTLAKLSVCDPFSWDELGLIRHQKASSDPQVKEASSLCAIAQHDLLWILMRLTPQYPAKIDVFLGVRVSTAPAHGIGG